MVLSVMIKVKVLSRLYVEHRIQSWYQALGSQPAGGINHKSGDINHKPGDINHEPGNINHKPGDINHKPGAINHKPGK